MSPHARPNRKFLIGAATSAIALSLATAPAFAQSSEAPLAGARALASEQVSRNAPITALVDAAETRMLTGDLAAARLALDDTRLQASAEANRASILFASDSISGASRAARLSVGAQGIDATADTLATIGQRSTGSPVRAGISEARLLIETGAVGAGAVQLLGNEHRATAFGNEAAAAIDVAETQDLGSVGLLAMQRADAGSRVSAFVRSSIGIETGLASASTLTVGGNLSRSLAFGNSLDSEMSVSVLKANAAPGLTSPASVVDRASGEAAVAATYAIHVNQLMAGSVDAEVTGVAVDHRFGAVGGALSASRVTTEGNSSIAGGYGNRSANALVLEAAMLARASGAESPGGGSVADITNVQRLQGPGVSSRAEADWFAGALGEVTDSHVSVADNRGRAEAFGNFAEANRLSADLGPAERPLSMDMVSPAGAVLSNDGQNAIASAGFSVHNVQDYGQASVLAQSKGAAKVRAGGVANRASLAVEDNLWTATASGNHAANSLEMRAASFQSTASLNNVQAGDGNVRAQLGTPGDPVTASVRTGDRLIDGRISVAGNAIRAGAAGNVSGNMLTIDAGAIAGATGGAHASAGEIGPGAGAVGDFALANVQRLGLAPSDGAELRPQVTASVNGEFRIVAERGAVNSSFTLADNAQLSTASGNASASLLSVKAATLGSADTTAPVSALYAAQYGHADVLAVSTLALTAPGGVVDSGVSIARNVNLAQARVNDADNRLAVEAGLGVSTPSLTLITIDEDGRITGDHGLGNLQVASGSTSAVARTVIDSRASDGIANSTVVFENNVTAAEASANHAVNQASLSPGGSGSGGIGNLQNSHASVTALAETSGVAMANALERTSLSISGNSIEAVARGNMADNLLTASAPGTAAASGEQGAGIDTRVPFAQAPVAILNAQFNSGAVAARASEGMVALSPAYAALNAPSIMHAGNAVSASAYGNMASNAASLTGLAGFPGVALANVQVNAGPVSAIVTGTGNGMPIASLAGASLSLTGNVTTATAVGNQATNIVTGTR